MKLVEDKPSIDAFLADFSMGVRSTFMNLGIDSFERLLETTAEELIMARHIGDYTLCKIRLKLWNNNKKLLKGDKILAVIGVHCTSSNEAIIGEVEL